MNRNFVGSVKRLAAVATLLVVVSGCEPDDGLVTPAGSQVVVLGQLSRVVTPASGSSTAMSLAGIEVSVENGEGTSVTDALGFFRVESELSHEILRLRFRRGAMDGRVDLGSVPAGRLVRAEFGVSENGVTMLSRSDSRDDDFHGRASLVSLTGDAPDRVLTIELARDVASLHMDVLEAATQFDAEGDLLTFAALVEALERGVAIVRIEGQGVRMDDGRIVAETVKVETGDHADDDGADTPEFEGRAALLEVTGDAPSRTLLIQVESLVRSIDLRVVEGVTPFDNEGDILSFGDLAAALQQGTLVVEVEGKAEVDADGVWVATKVKAETDEDDGGHGDDHGGVPGDRGDFDGVASLTGVSGEAPARTLHVVLTSVGGSFEIDVVEGLTVFDNEGDILSFSDLLAGLDGGALAIRIEGDGSFLDDGSVRADTIKVEIDD